MMPKLVQKLLSAADELIADQRQVVVIISSANEDRAGDVIVQAGIDYSDFMRLGGTVLWQHDPDQPIAKAIEIGLVAGMTQARVQFPPPGVSPKADEIFGLIQAGIVNASSIGFRPRDYSPIDPKVPWGATKFERVELMEFSFVSVPCNADAAIIARAFPQFAREGVRDASRWKCGASLNLTVVDGEDADAARGNVLAKAGYIKGGSPDSTWARKGFLTYDPDADPADPRGFQIAFADVVDGRLVVTPGSLKYAAETLAVFSDPKLMGLPHTLREKAEAVIAHYEAKMKPNDKALASLVKAADAPALADLLLKDAAAYAYVRSLLKSAGDGHVLGPAEAHHVKSLMKCLSSMSDTQTKALDLHGDTADQIQAMATHIAEASGHVKALQKAKRPKPSDGSDDPGDPDPDPDDPDDDDSDVELAAPAAERKRMADLLAIPSR